MLATTQSLNQESNANVIHVFGQIIQTKLVVVTHY